jgi:hypothetical protein
MRFAHRGVPIRLSLTVAFALQQQAISVAQQRRFFSGRDYKIKMILWKRLDV